MRLATLYPAADAFDAPSATGYTSTPLASSPHTSVRSPTRWLGSIFDKDSLRPPSPSSLFRSSSPSPSPPRRWPPPALPHQPRGSSGLSHAPPSPLAATSTSTSAARPSSSPSYGRRLLGRSLAEWPLTGSGGNAYTTERFMRDRPSLFDPPDLYSTGLFARPLSSALPTGGATAGSALGRAFNSSFGTPLSTARGTGLFSGGAGRTAPPPELDLAQTLAAVKGESSDATLATLQQVLEVCAPHVFLTESKPPVRLLSPKGMGVVEVLRSSWLH
jgi:hypothetical protein